jgi:hypothetical protein
MKLSSPHRTLVAFALAAGALVPLGAPAHAAAPEQTFAVGYRLADGEMLRFDVQATGVVSGHGSVTEGFVQTPTGYDALVTFHVGGGSVTIRAEAGQLERVLRLRACQATGFLDIPYTVVGGTGNWVGASGSGRLVEHQNLVGNRDGGACMGPDSGQEPRVVVGRIVAEGTLALP